MIHQSEETNKERFLDLPTPKVPIANLPEKQKETKNAISQLLYCINQMHHEKRNWTGYQKNHFISFSQKNSSSGLKCRFYRKKK